MATSVTILFQKTFKTEISSGKVGIKNRHKPQKCGNPTKKPVELSEEKTKARVTT